MINTRGAVILEQTPRGSRGRYEIVDLILDEPQHDELLVKMAATGLCHSDDHLLSGDLPPRTYPFCGGHEGAGVVEAVGPGVTGFQPGDHVVFSFLPVCGRCRWCATGKQYLCDLGRFIRSGTRPDDTDSYRMHLTDGTPVGQMSGIGAFAERTTVHTSSAVKVDPGLPLESLCLLGCSVGTGWGAAVYSGGVSPGQTVIVMGVGGVGGHAVQGARQAGATHVLAVDPVAFKRECATTLGATATFDDIAAAAAYARERTNGQGADCVIVTVGVVQQEDVTAALAATRKAGTVVLVALGAGGATVPVPVGDLTLMAKRLQGSLFGGSNPTFDIPWQTQMYRAGQLLLDEFVTMRYALDDINTGFEDMHAGVTLRGVLTYA